MERKSDFLLIEKESLKGNNIKIKDFFINNSKIIFICDNLIHKKNLIY